MPEFISHYYMAASYFLLNLQSCSNLFFRLPHVFELKPCNLKSHEMYNWIEMLQELSERLRTYLILHLKKNQL